jgi:hypothetical protein
MKELVNLRVMEWAATNSGITPALARIRRRMTRVGQMGFGARLLAFIEAVELITALENALAGKTWVDWQPMFEYVVVVLDPARLCQSFVVWNATIFSPEVQQQLGEDRRQEALDHLLNGLVTLSIGQPTLQRDLQDYINERII